MRGVLLIVGACAASPAAAQLRVVPDQPVSASAARAGVDVYLMNESDRAVPAEAPATLAITAADASRLTLVPAERAPATIAARSFARVRYVSSGVVEVAVAPPVAPTEAQTAEANVKAWPAPLPPASSAGETQVASANGRSSAFIDRFRPYEPIYGVAGLRDSGAKLQVSFALKPFGGTNALSYFTFAYTQTMFWAIDQASGPFRATTYSPEAFFDVPLDDRTRIGVGFHHDSNGRGDALSLDVNRVTARVSHSFDLGSGWTAELTPQAWFYVGQRETPSDFADYWGYTSLKASVGQVDGLKLSLFGRGNPGTGKGALEAFVSYPLSRLSGGRDGLGVYLFGQAFTGYGEALEDYRINDSHARIGIALTR
jgi:phospholipase A1